MNRHRQAAAPKPRPVPSRGAQSAPWWEAATRLLLSPWALAAAYALCVLPWLLAHRIGRYDVETDFYGEYAPHAARFRGGQIPEAFPYRGPGYHLVLAVAGIVIRDAFVAGKILSLLSGAAFVGLLAHWLGRRAGRPAGAVAALLAAVQPLTFLYGWTVGNDMFFAALVMATIVLIDQALDPPAAGGAPGRAKATPAPAAGPGPSLLAGLVAGYAGLTRPNGIFLLPVGLLAAVLFRPRGAPVTARRFALLFVAGWLVPTLLWPLSFHAAHHRWPASMNFRNMTEALFEADARVSVDIYRQTIERQVGGFGDFYRRYGPRILPVAIANLPKHLVSNARSVHGWPITLLAGLGLAVLLLRRPPRGFWLLPLAGALAFTLLLLAIDEARYSLLLAAPVAALGAAALFDPATGRLRALPGRGDRTRIGIAALVVVAVVAPSLLRSLRENRNWLGVEQIVRSVPRAAAFLRTLTSLPGPVAARKPHIAWWADRPHRGLPGVTLARLPDSLRARGAVFLYYGQVELEMQPQLYPLLTPEGIPPELQLIYVYDAIPIGALYRVLPPGQVAPPLSPELALGLRRLNASLEAAGLSSRILARQATDEMQRAKLLIEQGQLEEARASYEAAARLRPDLKEAQYGLGAVAVMLGRWSQGLAALEAAERLGVPSGELALYVGQAYYGLNRPELGAAKAEEFLRTNPGHAVGLFLLAACLESQGRLAEAQERLREARAAGFPEPGEIDALEARIRQRLGPAR